MAVTHERYSDTGRSDQNWFAQHLSIYNKTKSEYNGSMMKTIREFLEEQINEQLIQAVVSGRRTGEGPSKVKLRPVELKGQIFTRRP